MVLRFFILIFLSSCTLLVPAIEEGSIRYKDEPLYLVESFGPGRPVRFNLKGRERSIFKLVFTNPKKAKEYAMERRLLLLQKFETLIEPYFGTANEKKCQENITSDYLNIKDGQMSAVIQLLTSGPEHLLHDCLLENNSDWVNIEFLVCDTFFYDIRTYHRIGKTRPDATQEFFCK